MPIPIPDWDTFARLLDDLGASDRSTDGYAFRGHPKSAWTLEPTLHRSASDEGRLPLLPPSGMLELERSATDRFKQAAPIQLPSAVLTNLTADIDWWTVMKHYGAPTRLLDWTASPYVAGYFACASHPRDAGAIYFFHAPRLGAEMRNIHGTDGELPQGGAREWRTAFSDPNAPEVVYSVSRRTALPDRMLVQQGTFTVCRNVMGNQEVILQNVLSGGLQDGSHAYGKLIIPAQQKPTFMRRFKVMNISAHSLFPGLDGIGKSIDEFLRAR